MVVALHEQLLKGAVFGAAVGCGIGAMGYVIKRREIESQDLGVDVVHVRSNPKLMDVLSRLKEFRTASERASELYVWCVKGCEALAASAFATGGEQIKANRVSVAALSAAKALSREALRCPGVEAGRATQVCEELEQCLSDMVHNMMLGYD